MRALITWKWARVEKACRSGVEAEVGEKIFKLRAQKPRVSAYFRLFPAISAYFLGGGGSGVVETQGMESSKGVVE